MSTVDLPTWLGLQQLYADYALAVDSGQWDLWPEFFPEQCVYSAHSARRARRV